MPPRQVYGKKRTARTGGYDPDAIFGSLRCNKSSPAEVRIAEVVEEIAALNFGDDACRERRKCSGRQKSVLIALDGNSLPRVKAKSESRKDARPQAKAGRALKSDGRRRGRRQPVVEDSDEENACSLEIPLDIDEPCTPSRTLEDKSTTDTIPQSSSKPTTPRTPPTEQSIEENLITTPYTDLLTLSSHDIITFDDWSDQLSEHFNLTKIAEASFGEVYRLSLLQDLPGFSTSDESVLKVIALRPDESSLLPLDKRKRDALAKKMAGMSLPGDVVNEVKLLQRMSTIPGFTNFRDVHIIQGRPPTLFQSAYEAFNASQKARGKEPSHFPDPKKKSNYAIDQLWAVIEMQDAGADLERLMETGDCKSIFSIWDVFWQVALSIAKGEEGAQFEHRDLHLGNICVRGSTAAVNKLDSTELKGRKLHFTPLETTIIDYTLSRANLADGTTAFHDLANPENAGVFTGDSTTEYQYDIYRYMRGAVLRDDVYADFSAPEFQLENRSWEQFHPITNLVWLHYILYKLLEHLAWPSEEKAPPRRLKAAHAHWKRAIDLEHVLLRVQDMLDPGQLGVQDGLASVGDLVGLALRESWLDVEDVVGDIMIDEEESESSQEGEDSRST